MIRSARSCRRQQGIAKRASEESSSKILCAIKHSILRFRSEYRQLLASLIVQEMPIFDSKADSEVEELCPTEGSEEFCS